MKGTMAEKRREILNRIGGRRQWYSISNKAGPVAEIRIYDEIGFWGITAEDFVQELDEVTAPEIVCSINCPGGDVFDGIAIYNALRTHSANVTTRVDSLAGSIASVIVQAGDHRTMLSSSQMMIHDAWGIALGTAAEMREFADLLDMQSDIIANIYATRSGKELEHFRDLMGASSWLTDKATVDEGLADEVTDPGTQTQDAIPPNKKLSDEISETVDAVSETIEGVRRVAALRAEKGKQLSQVNRQSLDELRQNLESLQALLTDEGEGVDAPPTLYDEELELLRSQL